MNFSGQTLKLKRVNGLDCLNDLILPYVIRMVTNVSTAILETLEDMDEQKIHKDS